MESPLPYQDNVTDWEIDPDQYYIELETITSLENEIAMELLKDGDHE